MSENYSIIYKESSQNDILSILDYISTDNPDAASVLIKKITDTIGNLSEFPFIGALPKEAELRIKGYRILIINSYIVFYVPVQSLKETRIHRVLSSRQNYSKFL